MTEADEFDDLALRLKALGCAPEEIVQVETDYGQALPPQYRRFLETMGRDAGGLLGGSDLTYPEVLGMRVAAIDLLNANESSFVLPADALVFMMHQGYMLWFLIPEDLKVRSWSEGEAKVVAASLVQFLLAEERSATLSPDAEASHRRSTAATRRLRFYSEACPKCSAPFTRWEMDLSWGPGELNPGRERMVGTCHKCGRQSWRWSDSPDAPLKRLTTGTDRPARLGRRRRSD
jgi:hypothetical protein